MTASPETKPGTGGPNGAAPLEDTAALVRAQDPDRFFAGLFAPETDRPGLFALYAFGYEIARVREIVSDPMVGMIRLQWWRDAVTALAQGKDAPVHGVVQGLEGPIADGRLDPTMLLAMINAREADLEDVPFAAWADLDAYVDATAGALITAAAGLLTGRPLDRGPARDTALAAGRAWGLTGLARVFGLHAQGRHTVVPRQVLDGDGLDPEELFTPRADGGAGEDKLAAARQALISHGEEAWRDLRAHGAALPREARPAILYLSLVPLYRRRLTARQVPPLAVVAEPPLYSRLSRLFWANLRGRI